MKKHECKKYQKCNVCGKYVNKSLTILICGKAGSGKTYVANLIKKNLKNRKVAIFEGFNIDGYKVNESFDVGIFTLQDVN